MLKLKDLQNRVYSGKECIRFECEIPYKKNYTLTARFERMKSIPEDTTHATYSGAGWTLQIIISRTRDKDTEVYNFGYIMPRNGLPLELIAATGLKYFQLYIKEEVQAKSNLDFELGNILQGM